MKTWKDNYYEIAWAYIVGKLDWNDIDDEARTTIIALEDRVKNDFIFKKFFDKHYWDLAIAHGFDKDQDFVTLRELSTTEARIIMKRMIVIGLYHIGKPRTAKIPKNELDENGQMKYRTVFMNTLRDRLFHGVTNNILFDLTRTLMVHPCCKSYLTSMGCGKVVQSLSRYIKRYIERIAKKHFVIGKKYDIHAYFDEVDRGLIMRKFDEVERVYGKSVIIDIEREYYNMDYYYDSELKQEVHKYQGLKQGCAVGSWLADVCLYELDEEVSKLDGVFVRYSDDMVFIGPDYEKADAIIQKHLAAIGLKLNETKTQTLWSDEWFKFLGFELCGGEISLSQTRIDTFQERLLNLTINSEFTTMKQMVKAIMKWWYGGDGRGHSWATGVLPVLTNKKDVVRMTGMAMDCIRAKLTGKTDIGKLIFIKEMKGCCIKHTKGRHVKENKRKIPRIEGYLSLGEAQGAIKIYRPMYDIMVNEIA